MRRGIFVTLLLICACIVPALAQKNASAKKPFERFDGCNILPSRWNDGDTLRAKLPDGREGVFRLEFVDAPEIKTRMLDRHEDQENYFGISSEALKKLAGDASDFVGRALERPFTIYTCWRPVFASNRYYAFVVTADGTNLIEELVSRGLVQIHGHRTATPDGRSSQDYAAALSELEKTAKAQAIGGWKTER